MTVTELTGQVWTVEWSKTDVEIFLVLGRDEDFPTETALLNLETGQLDGVLTGVLDEGKFPHWKRIA